jgi:methyltransferase (TIGR00027 family)
LPEAVVIENRPSRTAERVAMHRAAHQVVDRPRVFEDPIALRMAGASEASVRDAAEQTTVGRRLRAFMVARSRCAEDELRLAVERGVRQYVVLGAGLDTFAYRNPYAALRVFEVDHPATQVWKRTRLDEAGIPLPPALTFAPVDFETQTLADGLGRASFDAHAPAFFSWLGVTPYLTADAVMATLRYVASTPAGGAVVFDYAVSPSLLDPVARSAEAALARRVAAAGEPWRVSFDPAALAADLRAMGFLRVEDLDGNALNARFFAGRSDGLVVGSLAHVMQAWL